MVPFALRCRSPWPGRPERVVPCPPGATLFEALRAAGQPIGSSCGADAVCGRCVVAVLDGRLRPPSARELALLASREAAPNERLACVARPIGSVILTADYW